MDIDRRFFVLGGATLTANTAQSTPALKQRRVSQEMLDEEIRLHTQWRIDLNSGRRANFSAQDLSGLRFRAADGGPVYLDGADFTQANLSETEASDIRVHHCAFNGANLDDCRWRLPAFAFSDMRRISARRAKWGTQAARGLLERPMADFSHTALHDADLAEAIICGFFYGTKLVRASLVRADLSLSTFLGPKDHNMSFSCSNMSGAKLRDCEISSASFYNADCSDVDFSGTIFSDARMNGTVLTNAIFHRVEIDRRTRLSILPLERSRSFAEDSNDTTPFVDRDNRIRKYGSWFD